MHLSSILSLIAKVLNTYVIKVFITHAHSFFGHLLNHYALARLEIQQNLPVAHQAKATDPKEKNKGPRKQMMLAPFKMLSFLCESSK